MGRISKSIELFKQSWGILKQDRELVWLPAISAIVSLIIAAIVLVPLALAQDWGALSDGAEPTAGPGTIAALVLMSLALTFIAIFFRAALVSGANERMTGGDPTVRSSIAGAVERLPKLFTWAVITAIVGSILRAIEERSGWLGRMVINMVGMAWAVTTFLVIPVIIIENTGAVDSTKRSVELFRRTWGENLSAQVGFSLIGFLVFIPIVGIAILGGAIGSIIGVLLIAAAVIVGVMAMMIISALGAIFQTALYHHAVGNVLTDGFEPAVLQSSFAPK